MITSFTYEIKDSDGRKLFSGSSYETLKEVADRLRVELFMEGESAKLYKVTADGRKGLVGAKFKNDKVTFWSL